MAQAGAALVQLQARKRPAQALGAPLEGRPEQRPRVGAGSGSVFVRHIRLLKANQWSCSRCSSLQHEICDTTHEHLR